MLSKEDMLKTSVRKLEEDDEVGKKKPMGDKKKKDHEHYTLLCFISTTREKTRKPVPCLSCNEHTLEARKDV